ncbi:response regulator transcription factor [Emcibacter nanhaiensis]|uniref:Response regulator transcription factor n=1 Tax=Emcibacter nanhaiensis TaxID=1505037 RepID=A0A501PET7_9PROT|nr:response regulator transcription factor [Emcibacter nanhaiensis]TPD58940.1 response regulator transcription factor [Emcibacter nanhaiensis]
MLPTVLIADDHPLFRDALKQAIKPVLQEHKTVEASNLAEAREWMQQGDISLLLLDLHMSDSHGFVGLIEFRQEFPSVPIIVVSASEEPEIIARAIEFGASGFIPKSSSLEQMSSAIDAIMQGDIWTPDHIDLDNVNFDKEQSETNQKLKQLTGAQLKVLHAVVRGLLNKQIAHELGITEATVKAHLTAIFRKLDVINRTQAVMVAQGLDIERAMLDVD